MNELKPCPFCGGEAELTTFGFSWEPLAYGVQCIADAKRGFDAHGHQIAGFGSAEKAIEAWNTRADDYRHAAEYWQRMYENTFAERTCQLIEDSGLLHCSECGGVAEERLWAYWHYCPNCGAKVVANERKHWKAHRCGNRQLHGRERR